MKNDLGEILEMLEKRENEIEEIRKENFGQELITRYKKGDEK